MCTMLWLIFIFFNTLLLPCKFDNVDHDQPIWHVNFSKSAKESHMTTVDQVFLTVTDLGTDSEFTLYLRSEHPEVATVDKVVRSADVEQSTGIWSGTANITCVFIGQTKIYIELVNSMNESQRSLEILNLVVTRKIRVIDHVFTGSVALLVSLLYINFGAALDFTVLKGIFMKPIGPIIGFFGQFVIMPLCSYALGYVLFPGMPELQLGLFFTGVSPGGGASNIWTVILQGNINLSIIMTTISTFAAFGMMPFWIFTLGKLIFDRGDLTVPYYNVGTFALALIIPLFIGVAIQKFYPRASKMLVYLLKPISLVLILFIIVFAIMTNLYMFQLFSWKIILAGLGLPFCGYSLSWCVAKFLNQSRADTLAISIETGIQNTGIAIFLLRFTLPQPQADLTTVVPVAIALMTPLPLLTIYIYQRIVRSRNTYEPTQNISSSTSG